MAADNWSLEAIEEEARLHRLLGHSTRIKLVHVLRRSVEEGRTIFPTKAALVREYQACWDEKVGLTLLDFHIRDFERASVLSVVSPGKPCPQRRVMLKIEAKQLMALPLSQNVSRCGV